ncbi:antibiotic biosynthesis monooxygenase family protein [Emcibacter nanhaiensis]|uniref:Antibiotic biosynthesis monooxygenase n=1 Tax=Emcibacter nanhaiensis TaxID=1505037 RepID=A0A501PGE6_9PROT|nr:antibiotic biosynthesis monooxygenase family protein [Emcibacter nanhaiensis]TPD59041.1 antibiotic biosynthesis monooxygenase [Emcibacter nanhaiensis]
MIQEIAQIKIDPARAADFEAAVANSAPVFKAAKGCRGMKLEKVIEDPACYRLLVTWETVEDHMVHFRDSDGFRTWRANAGPFFVDPPVVVHSVLVENYF